MAGRVVRHGPRGADPAGAARLAARYVATARRLVEPGSLAEGPGRTLRTGRAADRVALCQGQAGPRRRVVAAVPGRRGRERDGRLAAARQDGTGHRDRLVRPARPRRAAAPRAGRAGQGRPGPDRRRVRAAFPGRPGGQGGGARRGAPPRRAGRRVGGDPAGRGPGISAAPQEDSRGPRGERRGSSPGAAARRRTRVARTGRTQPAHPPGDLLTRGRGSRPCVRAGGVRRAVAGRVRLGAVPVLAGGRRATGARLAVHRPGPARER